MEVVIINTMYDKALLERNRPMVVSIIQKSDLKVVKTVIVEREALASWFIRTREAYTSNLYRFIAASTSVVGEMLDVVDSDDKGKLSHSETKIPSYN